jgi:glycerol-3-phosphate acyltransferase PlsY
LIPALVVSLAVLVGSFPTGVLLTRALTGVDVRRHGSGNIGAANVARTAGVKVGALVALLDILKGVIPVLAGRVLGLDEIALALVGAAAVLGHDFSIFLRFRGGKGVATTLGALLALAPVATLLGMAAWLAVMLVSRYSSVASLIALALLPVFVVATHQPLQWVCLAAGLFVLAIGKHRHNLVRLARGEESKFERPSTARA